MLWGIVLSSRNAELIRSAGKRYGGKYREEYLLEAAKDLTLELTFIATIKTLRELDGMVEITSYSHVTLNQSYFCSKFNRASMSSLGN